MPPSALLQPAPPVRSLGFAIHNSNTVSLIEVSHSLPAWVPPQLSRLAAACASVATPVASVGRVRCLSATASFKLPDLTYDYGELEPFVRELLSLRRVHLRACAFLYGVCLSLTAMCRVCVLFCRPTVVVC